MIYSFCMDDTLAKEVGTRIRAARKRADLKMAYVAQQLGITEGALGHIERGLNLAGIDHLVRLTGILKCRITEFLPESVLTDVDRKRARDPQLQEVTDLWPSLNEVGRDHVVNAARFAAQLKGK